ncbi:MAG: glycoside hydrolase family 3 C-terminal domain-containing protein [Prevotellaceae bacterium]|jgi:beta-glucosidase|nr:glycoside hydrolase family 3 C-terminal domain-containing protein [Prevotellaceae bacterium]
MKNRKIAFLLLLAASCNLTTQSKKDQPVYKDAGRSVEERVNDLVSRMTLDEKVMQLNQYTLGRSDNANNMADPVNDIPAEIGSLIYFSSNPDLRNRLQKRAMEETRLGIPVIFGYDVIHGYRTVYPISLAQACSWNPELVKQACAVAAQEARMSGVDWTFSPMIDVARDGRWGRVSEGYGEDPYTNAVFGVASVKGYQGNDLSNGKNIAACLKHYIGYGASEAGRDYVYTEISRQTLWDTYMLPYEESVKAGVATLMSSFNDISGTPSTANHYILTGILKQRWGHDGFVVSDWGAIAQLCPQGVAKDNKEAAQKAFNAGVDMDMMNRAYDNHLGDLVKEGKVSEELLNDAVRRVLRVKFRLGLFENPYTPQSTEKERFLLPQSLKIAEQLSEESIVLLKNENNTLPLKNASKIAVIGPMAKSQWHLLGSWRAQGKAEDAITVYDGLEREFKDKAKLFYAAGCDFDGEDKSGFKKAVTIAKEADAVVVCLGEKAQWSGENASRSTIALPQIQEELVIELKKLGKPVILLLSSGRPLELNRLEKLSNAILQIWQPGIAGGNPVAGIVAGRINPSGKLSITFPYSTGQIPVYYNHRQSARPHQGKYQDIPSAPLYEFAHGLSYTTFEYGDLKQSALKVGKGDKLSIEVPVTNTGNIDGMETVHWFICDPVSSISRPVKELKHFEKQMIKVGETKIFRFEIDLEKVFGFVDGEGNRFLELGDYYIIVKDKKVKVEVLTETF